MSGCPPPSAWTDWLASAPEGRPSPLTAHLAECPSCRDEAAALWRAGQSEPAPLSPALRRMTLAGIGAGRRRRSWALSSAAAAAILLAVAGYAFWWEASSLPTPPPEASVPVVSRPLPRRHLVLGRAVAATVERGASVTHRVEGGQVFVSLESGSLRLESAGEPVRLAVGGLEATFGEAEVEAGWLDGPRETAALDPGHVRVLDCGHVRVLDCGHVRVLDCGHVRVLEWLASAWAGSEGVPFVRVRSGSVTVRLGEESRVVEASEVLLEEGRLIIRKAVPSDGAGWLALPAPERLRDETLSLGVLPAADYRFEAVVEKRSPLAECALAFVAGGKRYEMAVGSAWQGSGAMRLAAEVVAGRCEVTAGSRVLVSCPVSQLGLSAYERSGTEGLGLRVWGGDVAVQVLRWRALP